MEMKAEYEQKNFFKVSATNESTYDLGYFKFRVSADNELDFDSEASYIWGEPKKVAKFLKQVAKEIEKEFGVK